MPATMDSFLCFFCVATLCYCLEPHFLQYSQILWQDGCSFLYILFESLASFVFCKINLFFSYVHILDIKVLLAWISSLHSFFS